jgi:hypothetical protein
MHNGLPRAHNFFPILAVFSVVAFIPILAVISECM